MVLRDGFEELLARGRDAEDAIESWLRSRGWALLRVTDALKGSKGPRIWLSDSAGSGEPECVIAPDLLGWRDGASMFFECKAKSSWTWHRASATWQTGIDATAFSDYRRVSQVTGLPVWILFLHDQGAGPHGLFGGEVDYLARHEHHRGVVDDTPMVFWARDDLAFVASVAEVEACQPEDLPHIDEILRPQPAQLIMNAN